MAKMPIRIRLQKKAATHKFTVPVMKVPENKQLISASCWMNHGQPKLVMHYAE